MDIDSLVNALKDTGDVLGRGMAYGTRNIKTSLPEALRNYVGNAEWQEKKQAQDLYGGDFEAQERADKMMGFGTDAGGLVGMIKASHGSPHMFDKFDFSKIGTGEGAQAYGHGGYFAQGFDSPVANMYADALGSKNQDLVNAVIDRVVQTHGGNTAKIKSELLSAGLPNERITPELETSIARIVRGTDPSDGTVSSSALKEYDSLQSLVPNEKHLYNVELKWPDAARETSDPLGEHHLLDWDAPIAEQPEYVRKALAGLNDKYVQEALTSKPEPVDDGDYWKYLGETYDTKRDALEDVTPMQLIAGSRGSFKSPKDASEKLKALGIPGIRYLDQGSRLSSGGDLVDVFKGPQGWHSKIKVTNRSGAGFSAPTDSFTTSMPFKTEQEARDWATSKIGGGTRNYVMFDDQIPEIVSRNGIPTEKLADLLRAK